VSDCEELVGVLTGDGASCGNPKTPDPRPEQ